MITRRSLLTGALAAPLLIPEASASIGVDLTERISRNYYLITALGEDQIAELVNWEPPLQCNCFLRMYPSLPGFPRPGAIGQIVFHDELDTLPELPCVLHTRLANLTRSEIADITRNVEEAIALNRYVRIAELIAIVSGAPVGPDSPLSSWRSV